MTDAWKDLGHRGPETYEEILARSLVNQQDGGHTEAQKAAKAKADKQRLMVHDAYFANQFIDYNGVKVSATLAGQFGVKVSPPDDADEGDMGEMR